MVDNGGLRGVILLIERNTVHATPDGYGSEDFGIYYCRRVLVVLAHRFASRLFYQRQAADSKKETQNNGITKSASTPRHYQLFHQSFDGNDLFDFSGRIDCDDKRHDLALGSGNNYVPHSLNHAVCLCAALCRRRRKL